MSEEIYSININTDKLDEAIAKLEKLSALSPNIPVISQGKTSSSFIDKKTAMLAIQSDRLNESVAADKIKSLKKQKKQERLAIKESEDSAKLKVKITKINENEIKKEINQKKQSFNLLKSNTKDFMTLGSSKAKFNQKFNAGFDMLARNPSMTQGAGVSAASIGSMVALGAFTTGLGVAVKILKTLTKTTAVLAGAFAALAFAAMKNTAEGLMTSSANSLDFAQLKAVNYAGNMSGLGKEGLSSLITGISGNINKYTAYPAYSTMGLDKDALLKMDRVEATFSILDRITKLHPNGPGVNGVHLTEDMLANAVSGIGLNFEDIRGIINQPNKLNDLKSQYNQGLGIYGGQNGLGQLEGERAIKRFYAQLETIGMNLATTIAPPLELALKHLTPYIQDLAKWFSLALKNVFNKDNLKKIDAYFRELRDKFKELSTKIFNTEFTKNLTKLSEGVGGVIKQGFTQFTTPENTKKISEALNGFINTLSKVDWTSAANLIKKAVDMLVNLGSGFLTLVSVLVSLGSMAMSVGSLLSGEMSFKDFSKDIGKSYDSIMSSLGVKKNANGQVSSSIMDAANKQNEVNYIQGYGAIPKSLFPIQNNQEFNKKIMELLNTDKKRGDNYKTLIDSYLKQGISQGQKLDKTTVNNLNGHGIKVDARLQDGIITKAGQIVKTDPKDYIFAMKNPESLHENNGSPINVTLNIGSVRDDRDIQEIKTTVNRLVDQLQRMRTGSMKYA